MKNSEEVKNNESEISKPIENENILEINDTVSNKNPSNVNFNFTDNAANDDEMEPVRDILSAGTAESEEMMNDGLLILTVDEVAAFLKGTYDVQGWITFPELWKRDNEFFYEIATGILPQVNAWAARFPAVAQAVKTVSAAGSWGRLIWDMAGTWVIVVRRRKLEAEKKKEEEEGKQQNDGIKIDYSKQQQQPATTNKQQRQFIIP